MSLIIKLILLMIAIGALIVVTLWVLTITVSGVSNWVKTNPGPASAIGAIVFLSIVAFIWRMFLWEEE